MRNVNFLHLVILLILMPLAAGAQQARFYDSQYRLPGSLIDRIFQDSHGTLWFTGKSGAIKYGGITFTREPLRYRDAPPLPWVKCIEFLDNEKILFGTSRGLVLNDCMKDTFQLMPVYVGGATVENYFVSSMAKCQKLGALLVTCSGNGITALDLVTLEPQKDITDTLNSLINTRYPGSLFIDSRNFLWTFSAEGNFIKIDLNTLTRCNIEFAQSTKPDIVTSIAEDPISGDLLIGTNHQGILRYSNQDGKIQKTNASYEFTGCVNTILRPSTYESSRCFWLGSEDYGLMLFDNNTQSIRHTQFRNDRIDLLNCKIHDIFEDRQGNIWAAAYQKGVVQIPKSAATFTTTNQHVRVGLDNPNFTFLSVSMNEGSGPNLAPVTAIVGIGDVVWAGTDGGGVIKLERGGKKSIVLTAEKGIPNNSITAMTADNLGNLWIATYNGGLSKFSPSGKLTNVFTSPDFQKISNMAFDTVNNLLYVGTLGSGTHVVRLNNGGADSINNYPNPKWVNNVFINSQGNVIVNSTIVTPHNHNQGLKINAINSDLCNCIAEDYQHNYYLGSDDWLCKYFAENDSMITLHKTGYTGSIKSMVIDRYGNLWYTTEDKLAHYSVKENSFESFSTMDGLPSNEFCTNAVYQDHNGVIYLGTNNGLTIFNPKESLLKFDLNAEIIFNTLTVAGENVEYGRDSSIIDAPINLAKRITLQNRQNKFALQFGINEYINQHRIKFRYRLKNFDDNWYLLPQIIHTISFTNIPEGSYTLEIEAYFDNNESQKVYKSIEVTVLPPWYNTWQAYLAYAVAVILILAAARALIKNRLSLKQQREENQKKEIRLQMFTNLSHEIRTPLSLVETPLNSLIETEDDKKKSAILQLMRRNVQRVTSQLNRIMDIRKIDNHKFKLKLQNADIVDFISDIVKSFDQLSLMRNININLNANNFDIKFAFDPYNLDKAVFNILSNAFKFTPDGGFININIEKSEEQFVTLKIENSGSHIPPDECEKVFERYYQTSNNQHHDGSGIGLHLAKMIIDAHKGDIKAYNTDNGVEFAITLPFYTIEQNSETTEPTIDHQRDMLVDMARESTTDLPLNKKLKKVLFIDDDAEWTGYISMALSDKFNIIVCNRSEQAINQIITEKPDAIITDLMMPGLDGFELVKKIRQNPQTSLLPIIVLTSKTDDDSQQICVETGVDHYLTKPVSINILKSSITNAISTREKMAARMTADLHSSQNVIEAEGPDQKLLKKVIDTINKNLESPNFGVNELSAKVGISRVHLNRKLKDLLDITPVNLIKSIKMRHAAVLLVKNKLNVADVAFKLGFSSHSYFSSHFKEYYGISPTEFVSKYTKAENEEEFEKMVKI